MLGYNKLYWILMGETGQCHTIQDHTWLNYTIPYFTGQDMLNFIRLYWTTLEHKPKLPNRSRFYSQGSLDQQASLYRVTHKKKRILYPNHMVIKLNEFYIDEYLYIIVWMLLTFVSTKILLFIKNKSNIKIFICMVYED